MKSDASIAIIGSGISGIAAAYLLQKKYKVTLFEKNDYLGGHTNTRPITTPDGTRSVDTGFIVFNTTTYPLFTRFLEQLKVNYYSSDMSFGFHSDADKITYSSDLRGLLLGRLTNMINPTMYRMIRDILRFNRRARTDLATGSFGSRTLGRYLEDNRFCSAFKEYYILPMASAIWSASARQAYEFPCETFIRFFNNHGLLNLINDIRWNTITGGSQSYIKAFTTTFTGTVVLNSPVTKVTRSPDGVTVHRQNAAPQRFDGVVIAAHADQALTMLDTPSDTEQRLLGPWRYSKNTVYLHTDRTLMPPRKISWASWNYLKSASTDGSGKLLLSYYMNRLQHFSTDTDIFVSLNSPRVPAGTAYQCEYEHPQYTFDALATQLALQELNGSNNTFFCGSYFGYGFHEDATRSAVAVAERLGVAL